MPVKSFKPPCPVRDDGPRAGGGAIGGGSDDDVGGGGAAALASAGAVEGAGVPVAAAGLAASFGPPFFVPFLLGEDPVAGLASEDGAGGESPVDMLRVSGTVAVVEAGPASEEETAGGRGGGGSGRGRAPAAGGWSSGGGVRGRRPSR